MKKTKIIILLCFLGFMAAKVQAQYTLTNMYDESGNRVQRTATLDVQKMAQNTVNDSITPKDTAVMNTILAEIDSIAEISAGVYQVSDSNNTLLESAIINVYPNPVSWFTRSTPEKPEIFDFIVFRGSTKNNNPSVDGFIFRDCFTCSTCSPVLLVLPVLPVLD